MTYRAITLSDPSGSLPNLVCQHWSDNIPQRNYVTKRSHDRFSLLGASIATGTAYASTMVWSCSLALPEAECTLLELYAEAARPYRIADEFHYLSASLITGQRTLLPGTIVNRPLLSSPSIVLPLGFASYPCVIKLPENPFTEIGFDSDIAQHWNNATFTVFELPDVVL